MEREINAKLIAITQVKNEVGLPGSWQWDLGRRDR